MCTIPINILLSHCLFIYLFIYLIIYLAIYYFFSLGLLALYSLAQLLAKEDDETILCFDAPNVQHQDGASDSGLFAIAYYASYAALVDNIAKITLDQSQIFNEMFHGKKVSISYTDEVF